MPRTNWVPSEILIDGPAILGSESGVAGARIVLGEGLDIDTGSLELSYMSPEDGSDRRAMRDKLVETISARDFGAVGNGTTDDTDAIQAAIDVAGSTAGSFTWPGVTGCEVLLPRSSGEYRCRDLVLPPNVSLRGHGYGASIRFLSGTTDGITLYERSELHDLFLRAGSVEGSVVTVTRPRCIMSNVRIHGDSTTAKGLKLLGDSVIRTTGLQVTNLFVEGVNGRGISVEEFAPDNQFTNVFVSGGADLGVYLGNGGNTFTNLHIYSRARDGLQIGTESDGNLIIGAYIERNEDCGVRIFGRRNLVLGGRLRENFDGGCRLDGNFSGSHCNQNRIIGNEIERNGGAGIILCGAQHSIIEGNTFSDPTQTTQPYGVLEQTSSFVTTDFNYISPSNIFYPGDNFTADVLLTGTSSRRGYAGEIGVRSLTLPTGKYITTLPGSGTATSATANNSLRVHPVYISRKTSIDRLAAEVTSAGESGSVVRLGIYRDNGNGHPGALVVDAGTIDGTSATVQEKTVSVTLTPGLYWFGVAAQSSPTTPPTLRTYAAGTPLPAVVGGTSLPTANQQLQGYADTASGALPATFTTSVFTTSIAYRMHMRAA